jgi:two-component system, cell cycle sensor histidine kinase and response regulator CckA
MSGRLMSRLLSLSIGSQLLFMALIVALPAAGLIIYSGIKLREAAITSAIQETRKISDGIANEQRHAAASAEQLMTALAQLPDIRNHDAAKTQLLLADILKISPLFLNISVIDPSGMVWASAITTKQVHVGDRRYFRNSMATGRLASGEYLVSRMASQPTINLCYPFKNSYGIVIGAISVAFRLDHLGAPLSQNTSDKYRHTLLDYKGIVLSKSNEMGRYVGTMDLPDMIQNMQSPADVGSFVGIGIDGKKRYVTYNKLRLHGENMPYMYVRASIPVALVVAQANAMLARNLLFFASSLLCALALAWLIAKHSIIDRVRVLQAASWRLSRGDLKVRVASGISGGELGELGTSFDEMAQQLEERERERDCAERSRRKTESRYRTLFDNSLFGIVAICPDHRFERVNEAFCQLLGYREDELVGVRSFADVTHPDDIAASLEKHQAMMRRVCEHYTLEKRYVTKTGGVVHAVIFVEGIFNEQGGCEGNIACVLDITGLRASQERMRLYFERQIVGMAIASPDKRWLETNARLQQMLGYSAAELARMSWSDLTHPDDQGRDLALFDQMLGGELDELSIETTLIRKDGSLLHAGLSLVCVRKDDGGTDYVLALYDDITERKLAEREILGLQSSLERRVQERTEQLETAVSEQEAFSYSVSHDLRSPLRHINSYLAILQEEYCGDLPPDAHLYLKRARAASIKMGKLIDDLLELARVSRSQLVKESVDLSGLAAGIVTMLRECEPNRAVEVEITPGLKAQGDKMLMGQVLENLLGNAWKYSSRRETTRLSFGVKEMGRRKAFYVRDNGAGFDMAFRDKLFGAFQRLHGEEYEGTGIGLATVKRIIDRHGGAVWAEAELDAGATFFFTLP